MKIEIDGCNFEVLYSKEPIIVGNKTCYGSIDYDTSIISIDRFTRHKPLALAMG